MDGNHVYAQSSAIKSLSRPGPPKSCCLFDCAGLKEFFTSSFPKAANLQTATEGRHLETGSGLSKVHLDESFMEETDKSTPISRGLLLAVRDLTAMNKELEKALDAADSDRVKAVLGLGANPNHFSGNRKETMLMTACFNRDTESVKHLLHAQADPNQTVSGMKDQVTPLMIAAEHGMHEAVAELIKYNADPHVRNYQGETALLAAARTNNHDAFALLIGSMVSQGHSVTP